VTAENQRNIRSNLAQALPEIGEVRGLIRVAQDNRLCAPQRGWRFTQTTPRQESPSPEGIHGIHHDEVEIAMELAVLEPVVEQQYIHPHPAQEFTPRPKAVSANDHRHIRQALCDQDRLVPHRLPRPLPPTPFTHHRKPRTTPTIPAQEDSDRMASGL
jgi:hypothetical protein